MSKTLPSSYDAECSVLGCLLIDNACYAYVAPIIVPNDFYDFTHKIIYEAIVQLHADGKPFDAITLSEHFATTKPIQQLGGLSYFVNLARNTPSATNVISYAKIVKDKSSLRELIRLSADINNDAYTATDANLLLNRLSSFIAAKKPSAAIEARPYLQSFSELLTVPPPVNWLIEHWVGQGKFCMLQGRPASAKSFIALDWALHISSGKKSWQGHDIDDPGTVVYLAGEGHHGVRRRIKAWSQYHNTNSAKLYVSHKGSRLDDDSERAEIFTALAALPEKPLMVIIDTLHEFSGGNLNDTEESGRLIRACKLIMSEFNTAVLLVHHTGHSETAQHRGMGNTRWLGALDTDINCSRLPDGKIILRNTKQKDERESSALYFELQDVIINDWLDRKGRNMQSAIIVKSAPPETEEDALDEKTKKYLALMAKIYANSSKAKTPRGQSLIYRHEIISYLVEHEKMSLESAERLAKPSYNAGLVSCLLECKTLSFYNREAFILLKIL